MREILFRAKKKSDGKWVEGYYIKAKYHWHEYGIHEDWIVIHAIQNGGFCNVTGRVAVDPETVSQFTGLCDKNGKKIWENDIVEAWSEGVCAKGKIKHRIDGHWIMYPAWQNGEMWYLLPNENGITTVEVIDNVFDNPELLEVN